MNIIFERLGTAFSGGKFSHDVDRALTAFNFKLKWTAGNGPVMEYANAPLKTYLPAINVTSYVTTKTTGQVKSCTQFPLSALFEYAAQSEGSIRVVTNPSTPLEVLEVWGKFKYCPAGALSMENDEQIRLELEGVPTAATFNLTIDALEAPVRDYEIETYDQHSVASNVKEKTVDLRGVDTLIFPVTADVLKEILLNYSNGVNCRYSERELQFIALDTNDLACAGGATNYGYSSHYVLDVQDVISMDVTTSGAGFTFFTVSNTPATKPSTAAAKNVNLQSTTDAIRMEKAVAIENK